MLVGETSRMSRRRPSPGTPPRTVNLAATKKTSPPADPPRGRAESERRGCDNPATSMSDIAAKALAQAHKEGAMNVGRTAQGVGENPPLGKQ